jgi:hypothetical protein
MKWILVFIINYFSALPCAGQLMVSMTALVQLFLSRMLLLSAGAVARDLMPETYFAVMVTSGK